MAYIILTILAVIVLTYYIFHYLEGNLSFQLSHPYRVWDFGTLQPKIVIAGDRLIVYVFGVIVAARYINDMERIDVFKAGRRTLAIDIGASYYIGKSVHVPVLYRTTDLLNDINSYIADFNKKLLL